jgi:hypothetical protein
MPKRLAVFLAAVAILFGVAAVTGTVAAAETAATYFPYD